MSEKTEVERLKKTYVLIENEIREIEDSIEYSNREIRQQNKEMWENSAKAPSAADMGKLASAKNYLDELERTGRALAHKKKRYDVLTKMRRSAYFGRIDFRQQDGTTDIIYIGLGTVRDEDPAEIAVYDWRAPICSLFYDSDKGMAAYVSPQGRVEGELLKRFQFKIEYDRIIHMIDSDIKIDDEMLIGLLSRNTDLKMKTIVTSIQKEQNRIIRDAENDVLIAVGPAGSGKTSIALHRIAYLLYRERDVLDHKNILVLTPNDVFSEYISTVLPELGESNVSETTIGEIAKSALPGYRFQAYGEYMELMLTGRDKDRLINIRTKTSEHFLRELEAHIGRLGREFFGFVDIVFGDRVIISAEEQQRIYLEGADIFPPKHRLMRIKNRIENIARTYRVKEFKKHYEQILEANEYFSTFDAKKLAKINVDRIFAIIDEEVKKIDEIDWIEIYLSFIKEKYPDVYDITKRQIRMKYLLYEDIVPLAYFLEAMGTGPRRRDIRHIIVDEMQDHPHMVIRYLSKIFGRARFTMVGDKSQALCTEISAYEPALNTDTFKDKRLSVIKLRKSYRSSVEIFDFCKNILSEDIYDSDSVSRHEKAPEIIELGTEPYRKLEELIKEASSSGAETIAVITKTAAKSREIYEGCVTIEMNHIKDDDSVLSGRINLMPSYYAKGLEFDCVIIPDGDDLVYGKESDRSILYAVCSRALHKLYVCYDEKPSRFISPLID